MNIPGILSLKTIKASSVNLPSLTPGMTISTIAHDSVSLTDIPFIPETCGITANSKLTANGLLFEVNLSLTIQGNDQSNIDLLVLLTKIPHIFIATDKNGFHYLIGTSQQSKDSFYFKFKNDPNPKGGRSIIVNIKSLVTAFPIYTQ